MSKLYADRDAYELGHFYLRHVEAMTAEGLHSKADIAAELGYRDRRIAELERELTAARQAAIPEGHVVVPVELTDDMLSAMQTAILDMWPWLAKEMADGGCPGSLPDEILEAAHKAMIASKP